MRCCTLKQGGAADDAYKGCVLILTLLLLINTSEILADNDDHDISIELVRDDDINNDKTNARWGPNFTAGLPSIFKPLVALFKNTTKVTKPSFVSEFKDEDINMLGSYERHPCRRICQQGKSLTCYYKLVVHNYQRLGPECNRCLQDANACESERCIYGDGIGSPVMAVNYMVPGPPIEVCENDTIIADVLNYLNEPSTMHWHGLHMSQTPDMDGGPFITQYPIQPGEVFRYAFEADRCGTVWYHSHMGVQRALGVAGSFVIRQTRQANRQAHLYDYDLIEHTLLIQDIAYNLDFSTVRNILINGKGRNHLNSVPDNDPRNRYERVRVSPGYRYRMRVITNGIFNCPIEFSIENHKMLMISTDGNDIEPIVADSFFMASAERFDFVLEANQYANNYWIRVRGYGDCGMQNLYQGAVLHYSGAARNQLPSEAMSNAIFGRAAVEPRIVVNYVPAYGKEASDNEQRQSTTNVATAALRSLYPLSWSPYTRFLTYYSTFSTRQQPNGDVFFQIDDISYIFPNISLLQARGLYQDDVIFCNRSTLQTEGFNCVRDNCQCTNVIRLPAYRPIEMVVANLMDNTHPFHMHGYTFRLVGQDVIGNTADLRRIQELDRRGLLKRLPNDFPAVEKDTIQIPGRGYIIVRFISDNPGFWLYHCHIEFHALNGMTAVMKIGENYQMRQIPPKLRC